MIDQNRHRTILVTILKDIYTDPLLRTAIGFKGGTAAFLFYDLPRLSVDLDFDLLNEGLERNVFEKLGKILTKFGKVRDAQQKRFTIFYLLDYGKDERKVKVEVSKRKTSANFEVQSYLGIPVLVMVQQDLAAGKLAAYLTRSKFAARDLFDLWYFLDQGWGINEKVFTEKTGKSLKKGLSEAIKKTEKVKDNQLLQGLGDLLYEKQKRFVKEKIKDDLIFLLGLYKKNSE